MNGIQLICAHVVVEILDCFVGGAIHGNGHDYVVYFSTCSALCNSPVKKC